MGDFMILAYFGILLAAIITLLVIVIYRERSLSKFNGKNRVSTKEPAGMGRGKADAPQDETDGEKKPRFSMLTDVDKTMCHYSAPAEIPDLTLAEFCDRFRNYAAGEKHLFYDESIIRQFVAGLSVSPILIMQGMSGTGKTSLARAFGYFISNTSTAVPIQPMWKERSDVIGYFNEFTKQFSESVLLKKLYEARYSDRIFVIVLDEMNIARVEYFFADFLSLMELNEKDRYLEMTSDTWPKDPKLFEKGSFRIPENVWFIGTANNDDSTFAISDKVYDRAMVMNLNQKARPFTAGQTEGIRMSYRFFEKIVEDAKKTFEMTARCRRKVAEIDRCLTEQFHITYGNRIRKQMEEYIAVYLACGGTEQEALDDFLMKKILRKLEGQNPIVIAKACARLEELLDELFEEDGMPLCRNYLHFLKQLAS